MKELVLANTDKKAIVDDDIYETLNRFRWILNGDGYVMRTERLPRDIPNVLHRCVVLDCPRGMNRDHKNGNKLDNQRSNLRLATHHQNAVNRKLPTKSAAIHSRFRGVSWHQGRRKWRASITVNRNRYHLGLFSDEREAAIAYNEAVVIHFGEFARLNPA